MTDKYAVIGNPVAHSKSPYIHAEFARQTGQDISYVAVLAAPGSLRDAVLEFRNSGGRGMNVTLPYKHEAWTLSTARIGDAQGAGAVNTLLFRGQDIIGHNTDGIGLLRDIRQNLECAVEGRRVLLMGAGGAGYGVIEPLLRERPDQIVVANRTVRKAEALVAHFAHVATAAAQGLVACDYAALVGHRFDIVINATSAGLSNEMPPLPGECFAKDAVAYDMVYGSTPFMAFAQAHGARAFDGTGMLVEQAAESFYIWRGVRPQTAPVIALLRRTRM
ncbi:MAG: shikimate dehydrogenase [Betaproteobacteria bacterium]